MNGATLLQPSPAFPVLPSSLVSPSFIFSQLMPSEGLVFAGHADGPGKSRKKKKKKNTQSWPVLTGEENRVPPGMAEVGRHLPRM